MNGRETLAQRDLRRALAMQLEGYFTKALQTISREIADAMNALSNTGSGNGSGKQRVPTWWPARTSYLVS